MAIINEYFIVQMRANPKYEWSRPRAMSNCYSSSKIAEAAIEEHGQKDIAYRVVQVYTTTKEFVLSEYEPRLPWVKTDKQSCYIK